MAFRAPETILRQPADEKIDIWSFGCLVYEVITGTQLFDVDSLRDDEEEEMDDDHLIAMRDILGELPEGIMRLWPRSRKWIGLDEGPCGPYTTRQGYDSDDSVADEDAGPRGDKGDDDDSRDNDFGDRGHGEDGRNNPEYYAGTDEDSELFAKFPLETLFYKNKPNDIDAEEAAKITALIRRILRYDASERPSVGELLKEKWFADV